VKPWFIVNLEQLRVVSKFTVNHGFTGLHLVLLTRVPRIEQHIDIGVSVPHSALFSQITHNYNKGLKPTNDAAGVWCYANGHITALCFHHTTLPEHFRFLFTNGQNNVGAPVFIR